MSTFGELVDRWWQDRNEENLTTLRDAVVSAGSDDTALLEATDLLRGGHFGQARDRMLRGMPRWFLSPAAHNLIAMAHQGLGNEQAAADERALSGLGLRVILESGTGSRFQPWAVLRVSDEYDICMYHRKRVIGQKTYGGFLDSLECSDGSSYWFALHRAPQEAAA